MYLQSPTDARVTEAAVALFAERGYAATTTRAIAEAAGVNEVTLFRRFGSKEGVLAAIGEWWGDLDVAALDDVADVRGTLRSWARQEAANSTEFGGFMLRMAFDARSVPEVAAALASDGGAAGGLRAMTDFFARAQAAGTVRTDMTAEALAECFVAMSSSPVMYRHMMGITGGNAVDAVDDLVDLFCDGALGAPKGE